MENNLILILMFLLLVAGFVCKMTGKYPILWDVVIFLLFLFLIFTPLL